MNKSIPVPGFVDHDSAILLDLIYHPQVTKPIRRRFTTRKQLI